MYRCVRVLNISSFDDCRYCFILLWLLLFKAVCIVSLSVLMCPGVFFVILGKGSSSISSDLSSSTDQTSTKAPKNAATSEGRHMVLINHHKLAFRFFLFCSFWLVDYFGGTFFEIYKNLKIDWPSRAPRRTGFHFYSFSLFHNLVSKSGPNP